MTTVVIDFLNENVQQHPIGPYRYHWNSPDHYQLAMLCVDALEIRIDFEYRIARSKQAAAKHKSDSFLRHVNLEDAEISVYADD